MTEPDSIPDDAYDTLSRLHDDPREWVAALTDQNPTDTKIATQQTVFKALANDKRLRILWALRDSELCTCELQAILNAPQSTVATHLRTLKDAGLVKSRKSGKWTYYRIADTATNQILDLAAAISTEE